MDESVIRFEDLFYVLLFREEIQNKSLMRFGKTRIPQVNSRVSNSTFSFLRSTTELTNTFFVLQHLGKYAMEGVVSYLDAPVVVQDCPDFIILDCNSMSLATPADLPLMTLPDMSDRRKGVVIVDNGIAWLTAHLVVEYSKLADWVAVGKNSSAVTVFTMVPEVPLGKIIEI